MAGADLTDNERIKTKPGFDPSDWFPKPCFEERGRMLCETVRRARRRILANEVVRQGAYAASAALAALVLLLVLGTEILNWPWLLALPAATLAAGAYATWRGLPSGYQVAQRVDRKLELADTLSTAVFFAGAKSHGSGDVRHAQWAQAENVAAGLDVRRATPIRAPKAIYLTALLALVASSLFALRYALDRRLDLRPPLARMVQEKLGGPETPQRSVAGRTRKTPWRS